MISLLFLFACGSDDTVPTGITVPTDESTGTSDSQADWRFLEGVWHGFYPEGGPSSDEASSGSVVLKVGGDLSATFGGEPAQVEVSDDPFSVTISADLTGILGAGYEAYTWTGEMVMDTEPQDGLLTGDATWVLREHDDDGEVLSETTYFWRYELYRVDRYDATELSGLALLGGSEPVDDGEVSANVRVMDDLAFVARHQDGLRIYDVSDPSAPESVGHLPLETPQIVNDVKLLRAGDSRYALLAGSTSGLMIVDVTIASEPVLVASAPPIAVDVHTLAVDGTTAYLAANSNRSGGEVIAVDLTDPTTPDVLTRWSLDSAVTGGLAHDLYVTDGIAYVCAWGAGLLLVDVSDPTEFALIDQVIYADSMTSHSVWVTDAPGQLVALEGGEGWGTHLRVIDVDPDSGTYLDVLGELSLRPHVSIHNIMMGWGTTAVMASYQDGVRLVDIAVPEAPELVGWANTWDPANEGDGALFLEGAGGVDVVDGRVYVADDNDDLLIYEVTGSR